MRPPRLSHILATAVALTLTLQSALPSSRDSQPSPSYQPPAFDPSLPDRASRVRALAADVDALYRNHALSNHIPGSAWGLVVDDTLVFSGAHGFTHLERQTPATPQSVFRIASMTKSFTAMAILRLRDAGRLNLDRPASRYLPELRRLPLLTRDAPPITLRHLLTHGAGFPEDNPWGDRQLADTDQDLVDLIRMPARFSSTPDTAYEYSNLGFALLGRAVARVSGLSCQHYISKNILGPLRMNSTFWKPGDVPPDRLAHGYRWEEDAWHEEELLGDGSFAPMGGMLSSVEDFARYIALHLSAWPPRSDPEPSVLRRSSLREMHHPWRISGHNLEVKDSQDNPCPTVSAYGYGLGWGLDCHQRVRIGHSGGLPGFGSQWRILPDYGIGIVAFGNVTYVGFSAINTAVLEMLIDRADLKPLELPPSAILRERANTLVRLLPDWNHAEGSGIFAENFFPDNPLKSLKSKSRETWEKAGEIQAVEALRAENQLRGTVTLRGAKADIEVFFTLTPENPPLIQEVNIQELPKNLQ